MALTSADIANWSPDQWAQATQFFSTNDPNTTAGQAALADIAGQMGADQSAVSAVLAHFGYSSSSAPVMTSTPTQAQLIQRDYPGAYFDTERQAWVYPGGDGGQLVEINTEAYGAAAQNQATQQSLTAGGYIADGLVTQDALNRSDEAHKRGVYTVDDYYRYIAGPGHWTFAPNLGYRVYVPDDPARAANPNTFDLGLAQTMDLGEKITLGLIGGAFGYGLGAAIAGVDLGAAAGTTAAADSGASLGGWTSAEGGAGYVGGAAADASEIAATSTIANTPINWDYMSPTGLDPIAPDLLKPYVISTAVTGGVNAASTASIASSASTIAKTAGAIGSVAGAASTLTGGNTVARTQPTNTTTPGTLKSTTPTSSAPTPLQLTSNQTTMLAIAAVAMVALFAFNQTEK